MARTIIVSFFAFLLYACTAGLAQGRRTYAGFDRNDYPGDAALPTLRESFRYTSYWLNAPPGEERTTWEGKRALLRRCGFGFLVLFNGRTDAELKAARQPGTSAADLGAQDGKAAVAAARHEGFPAHVRIFLDQEEGGRLLPEQSDYLFAWVDAVRAAGARAGVYCSGIDVPEGNGTISTASDIAEREKERMSASSKAADRLSLWVADDRCPPSPGCALPAPPLAGIFAPPVAEYARVWQYAQSPRRAQFSAGCPANQNPNGSCYAPGTRVFVDMNGSDSPDPSEAP